MRDPNHKQNQLNHKTAKIRAKSKHNQTQPKKSPKLTPKHTHTPQSAAAANKQATNCTTIHSAKTKVNIKKGVKIAQQNEALGKPKSKSNPKKWCEYKSFNSPLADQNSIYCLQPSHYVIYKYKYKYDKKEMPLFLSLKLYWKNTDK